MSELDGISVVLPSLDPDEKLLTVIDGLLEYGFSDIILVNDGSKAENLHYFEIAAQNPHVQLLHHNVNRGKGAALKTAFDWFLHNRPSGVGVITVDGDNQHHPADTSACAKEMLRSGELVLGVRNFSLPQVPFRSRAGNRITSFIFKIFVGMKISDTQTGLRAIPKDILPVLCSVSGDRFEYETNMLLAMKEQSIPFREVKIRTVYIEENKSSHFRAVRDSWRIYKLILAHFFRYTASSLISAVVDEGLYILLTALLRSSLYGMTLTAVATFGSRAVSSLINFILNKNVVFHAVGSTGKAMLRYYTVAVPTALLQMLLTHGINTILQIDESWIVLRAAIYAFVMIGLYFATFLAQKHWVFAKERQKTKLRGIRMENAAPVKKRKVGKIITRIILRTLLVLFTLIILIAGALYLVCDMIFNGPSESARNVLTMSMLESSGMKWFPALFIGEEKVLEIQAEVNTPLPDDFSDTSQVVIQNGTNGQLSSEWEGHPDGIRIEALAGDTYNAHIMLIRDPSSVYLATSANPFSMEIPGTSIDYQMELEGAIAGINAGAFYDNGTSDPKVGSVPQGLVIAGGQVVWNSGWVPQQGFVGFNQDNILVVAQTMSASQAQELGIRDGCCFGPVLIMNSTVNQSAYNENSGYNPRTAIGQRADGTIIFLCVDGRQTSSLGATYADIIDIMVEYGAVNACNLDGGSSTIMYYRDNYGKYSEEGTLLRINNYSLLQDSPRRMPTFFMVRPANEED